VEAPDQLAIIAGNGIYPRLLATAARVAGVKQIAAIAFTGETDPKLASFVDEISWLRVGQLNRMLTTLRDWKISRAIMAGQIAPRNLFDLRPDWRALLLLAKLKQRNAESIFSAIGAELERVGVSLLPATTFLEDLLAREGLIAGPKLSRQRKHDVTFGWNIARKIAALDIGQTIVVRNGTVLAVEASEGTNEAIRRGGLAGSGKAIVVKVSKPKQDMRFDVPVIGVDSIRVAAESKISVIAVEAGRTLLLEREAVIAAANQVGIAIVGFSERNFRNA
jgi:UDP-2,3-diacylglucosamine hydrolase